MNKENLFKNLPDAWREEIFETILEGNDLKIERIISEGQSTPASQWYDQEWDEWVALLLGSAGILFEGDDTPITLRPGDYLFIPAHTRHSVAWTDGKEKTVWLAIHMKKVKS
jgi:cupin 2 domain-containing protein